MAMIDDVKIALRITSGAFDGEIADLIAAARQDLVLSGVLPIKANNNNDTLIKRAIISYCKAHFGYGNKDAQRLEMAYNLLKMSMTLSGDYT